MALVLPSKEDIDHVIAILQKIPASKVDLFPELVQEGNRVFGRGIRKSILEDSSLLKVWREQKRTLKRLEKVHDVVQTAHANYVESSSCAGINVVRESRNSDVNTLGRLALTTDTATANLAESLIHANLITNSISASSGVLISGSKGSNVPLSEDIDTDFKSQHLHNNPSPEMYPFNTFDNSIDCCLSVPIAEEPMKTVDTTVFSEQSNSSPGAVVAYANNNHPTKQAVDFRMGGLGRSRGRKATFSASRIRGLYDDPGNDNFDEEGDCASNPNTTADASASRSPSRRAGKVIFQPRQNAGKSGGWLCYVIDNEDLIRRACALRTVLDLSSALEGVGVSLIPGVYLEHSCSYVIGNRRQRWAYLGGEVEDLSGETAISVRLVVDLNQNPNPTTSEDKALQSSEDVLQDSKSIDPVTQLTEIENKTGLVVPPTGSFRRHCNVCKQQYLVLHPFYHQLCGRCGDFNLQKRMQSAPMAGYVCVVTGGRVRIGYQIVLKLLRAGATVITTTRWPRDAALRFKCEHDSATWLHNLTIDFLELSDTPSVEAYCERLKERYPRIHVLINNAAQTLTRPAEWTEKMNALERDSVVVGLLHAAGSKSELFPNSINLDSTRTDTDSEHKLCFAVHVPGSGEVIQKSLDSKGHWITLDGSGQPLDLSGVNSWSSRLGEISTKECVDTLAVNVTAPFVLCSKLKGVLAPCSSTSDLLPQAFSPTTAGGLIVNVTALEGKFNVGKKSGGHPHTNMAKAALNMLTLTAARTYARDQIYMSSVDTGWVTDMFPLGVGPASKAHETFVGPPLDDEDGAARVLDPVFTYINSVGAVKLYGYFLKDYMKASW